MQQQQQQYAQFAYPTPPASPDNAKCNTQQFATTQYQQCLPLAPEDRLGMLLEGKLHLTDILGTGAYGVVYLAIDISTGVRYAVKCLSKFNLDGTPLERRQVAYQQREIRLHYLASAHPNVVTMHKIVDHTDCIFVILEYCQEGDLFLNITERGQYVGNDELSRDIFLQILDAVEHCHQLGIYHRDLKPENVLVTEDGNTVKLADFGLATSEDRSEDYGCGSTFYMSPECLDPSSRKPFYMCAPNDVWSLGVILVNLTCGRNPWKQASLQDSTYRAYSQSRDFLKTILPVTDDLNDILARIFNPSPEHRITLPELRVRIQTCPQLTLPPMPVLAQTVPSTTYVNITEDVIIDDYECDSAPLSPASSCSDEGSLISSASTVSVYDDDEYIQDQQEVYYDCSQVYEPEVIREQQPVYHGQEFVPQHYTGPVPVAHIVPQQAPLRAAQQPVTLPPPAPIQPSCQPKGYFQFWDVVNRYVQQVPIKQHVVPFHHQVPVMNAFPALF